MLGSRGLAGPKNGWVLFGSKLLDPHAAELSWDPHLYEAGTRGLAFSRKEALLLMGYLTTIVSLGVKDYKKNGL